MTEIMPNWAERLLNNLAMAVEGFGKLEGRHFTPDETSWGVDLVQMAPALLELVEAGPQDGAETFEAIHSLDLMVVQEALDQVHAFSLDFNNESSPEVTVEGLFEGHEVVVLIYAAPFEDTEVRAKLDTIRGGLILRSNEDEDEDDWEEDIDDDIEDDEDDENEEEE